MTLAFSFPSRLYAILDLDITRSQNLEPLDVVSAWLDAGVRVVQLRAKTAAAGEMLSLSDELAARCRAAGALFILNDRADIASMANADGVHVGQDDLAASDVRRMLGDAAIVGVSTHTEAQLESACAEPVSYVAIGPVFETATKASDNAVVGLEGVSRAAARARAAGLPLVAIGGISLKRARSVIDAGADAVAVISDLMTGDVETRAGEFLRTVES